MTADNDRQRNDSPNPFVFVVGCPRSGTTLLQRMLDSHARLAVAYDSLFIPPVYRQLNSNGRENDLDEAASLIAGFKRYARLGLPEEPPRKLAHDAKSFSDLVSAIYDAFAELHDKPLGGEKSPAYVRHMPLLQELFPRTRFIHLIRDGRDVALSLMDWGKQKKRPKGPARKYRLWQEDPAAVSALWWEHKTLRGRRDAQRLREGSYLEVSYERLVEEPDSELRRVTGFLDLPFDERMVHFYSGKTRRDPNLSAKSAWLPATKGIRDYRRSMALEDLQIFEALAGDSLRELGYELACDAIPVSVRKRAMQYRENWQEPLD